MDIKCAVEYEMDKKLQQRKKTRLLQVRQQAKDFARNIRENVLLENMCQQKHVLEEKKRKFIQGRKEKLKHLEEIYQSCLESVGEGHKNAITEPNIDDTKKADAVQKAAESSERGKTAVKKLLERETIHRQQREAPIIRKKNIRTRENLRSCFISSLPKPGEGHKDLPSIINKNSKRTDIFKKIPRNLPTEITRAYNKDVSTNKLHDTKLQAQDKNEHFSLGNLEDCENCHPTKVQDYSNQCLSAHFCCCCHSIFSRTTTKRRCYSDSVCSSESPVIEPVHKTPKKTRLRSRSCSPRVVKILNYTDAKNLYESKQPSLVNVIHHQEKSPETKEKDVTDIERGGIVNAGEYFKKNLLKRKTDKRCAKALNREQVKKDFQELLSDLGKLSQNRLILKNKNNLRPLIQKGREIEAKNKIKQEKLVEAFKNLLNTEKSTAGNLNSNSSPTQHTGEDWSLPTLNLAAYSNYYYEGPKSIKRPNDYVEDQQGCPISDQLIRKEISDPTNPSTDQESCDSTDQQMSTRNSPGYKGSRSQSPCSPRSKPLELSRKSGEPSEVIVRVKVNGPKAHKKKCRKSRSHHAQLDSSTSYFSPPEYLTPSQKHLLDAILSQVNKKTISEDLKRYIKTLLSMSRESIDELNVSSSSIACSESVNSPKESRIKEDMLCLSALTEKYADKVLEIVDMFERMDSPEVPERYMEPPRSLQSQTKLPASMSPCPPPASPSLSSGTHVISQCRYCQLSGESESKFKGKVRPKTPPPRPRYHRTKVKHGQQTVVVPEAEHDYNPIDSNYYTNPTLPRIQSPFPPVHPSGYSAQYFSPDKPPCPSDRPSSNSSDCPSNESSWSPNHPSGNSPHYPCPPNQSPVQRPNNQGFSGSNPGASSSSFRTSNIQTPFGLSSNLLPHPKEVFGQQGAAHTGIPTISEISEGCIPCPDNAPGHDDSMRWIYEVDGIPPPPPSDLDPVKVAEEYRQELRPDQDTIRTPNSSFDMVEYLNEAEARIQLKAEAIQNKATFKRCPGAEPKENALTGFGHALEKNAVLEPLDRAKMDSMRSKLKRMNDEQYKAILEMLQKGAKYDQNIIEFYKKQMEAYQELSVVPESRTYNAAANPNTTAPPSLYSFIDKKIDNLTSITMLSESRAPKFTPMK